MSKKRQAGFVAGATVVGLIGAGVAFAAIPNSGVITGCYAKSGGTLRVIDTSTTTCKSGETPISWNQQGTPGADGTNGTNGTNGVSGYELVTRDDVLNTSVPTGVGGQRVECPAGKKVVGGGATAYGEFGNEYADNRLVIEQSMPSEDGTAWVVSYRQPGNAGPYGVRIRAACVTVN